MRKTNKKEDIEEQLFELISDFLEDSITDVFPEGLINGDLLETLKDTLDKNDGRSSEIAEGCLEYLIFFLSRNRDYYEELKASFNFDNLDIQKAFKELGDDDYLPSLLQNTIPPYEKPAYNHIKNLHVAHIYKLAKQSSEHQTSYNAFKPFLSVIQRHFGFIYRYVKNRSRIDVDRFIEDVILKSPNPLTLLERNAYYAMFIIVSLCFDKRINIDVSSKYSKVVIVESLRMCGENFNPVKDIDLTTDDYKKTVRPLLDSILKDMTSLTLKNISTDTILISEILECIAKKDVIEFKTSPEKILPYTHKGKYTKNVDSDLHKENTGIETGTSLFSSELMLLLQNYNFRNLGLDSPITEEDWVRIVHAALINYKDERTFFENTLRNLIYMLFVKEINSLSSKIDVKNVSSSPTEVFNSISEEKLRKENTMLKTTVNSLDDELHERNAAIAALENRIKELEQENLQLKRDVSNQEKKHQCEIEKLEDKTKLVPSLLSALYEQVETSKASEDGVMETTDTELFKELIKDKKVVLVGGHQKFLAKVHLTFPSIYTIAPRDYIGENQVKRADIVLYVTMIQNHGQFLRLSPHFHNKQQIIFINDITSMSRLSSYVLSEYNRLTSSL